jgi:Domain of unknown function (DUF397)
VSLLFAREQQFTVYFRTYRICHGQDMTRASVGICDDNVMITTLRHRLITISGQLGRHASQLILRLPSRRSQVLLCDTSCGHAGLLRADERLQMPQITNGVLATWQRGVTWRKSRHSNPSGNCVELAELPAGRIAVRSSQHPSGPALIYTRAEMAAFLQRVKDGAFDGITR